MAQGLFLQAKTKGPWDSLIFGKGLPRDHHNHRVMSPR